MANLSTDTDEPGFPAQQPVANPSESPALSPTSEERVPAMCRAVAGGLTVRVAIKQVYGSKCEYYTHVSMEDRLLVRRLAKANTDKSRQGEKTSGIVSVSVYLESERHEAVGRRNEQLSIQKGRLVTINEYVNTLIAADLRSMTIVDSALPVATGIRT